MKSDYLKITIIFIIILFILQGYAPPNPTPPSVDSLPSQEALYIAAPSARTRTPTPTPNPPTPTPTPSPSVILPTPTQTNTPMPGQATPTPTPVAADPCSLWHPYGVDLRYPGLGAFDFGVNPCEYIGVFGSDLEDYLVSQNVDGLPHSSNMEEVNGYTFLYVRNRADGTQDMLPIPGDGCAFFVNVTNKFPDDGLCITNALLRVHMPGDANHDKKRFHSIFADVRFCEHANGLPIEPCGTALSMAIEDWGVKHNPYKKSLCYDDTTPRDTQGNLYPFDLIDQPPYAAFQPARNGYAHKFVSTITFNSSIIGEYYPLEPNHIIRASWNMLDAPEIFTCGDEPLPTGYLGVKFILHAVIFANLPPERPYNGFTDQNGHIDTSCEEISPVCFPLIISASAPIGTPFMSYPVQFDGKNADGTSTGVIIQDFGP